MSVASRMDESGLVVKRRSKGQYSKRFRPNLKPTPKARELPGLVVAVVVPPRRTDAGGVA